MVERPLPGRLPGTLWPLFFKMGRYRFPGRGRMMGVELANGTTAFQSNVQAQGRLGWCERVGGDGCAGRAWY